MRASVVLREGWRTAGYEGFCSAPRGCRSALYDGFCIYGFVCFSRRLVHDGGLSIECATNCAAGVLFMRASPVLREGWRTAGYEGFCSAPRGCRSALYDGFCICGFVCFSRRLVHDGVISIECASNCAAGVLYMRASVVLREGWRTAGYEGFCSAPRELQECSRGYVMWIHCYLWRGLRYI